MDSNPITNKFKSSLEDTLKNTPHNKIALPSGGVVYDKDNVLLQIAEFCNHNPNVDINEILNNYF